MRVTDSKSRSFKRAARPESASAFDIKAASALASPAGNIVIAPGTIALYHCICGRSDAMMGAVPTDSHVENEPDADICRKGQMATSAASR